MAFTKRFLATYLVVLLFLVTRAAWVSLDISIKCVGASCSFLPPFSFFHYVLQLARNSHPQAPPTVYITVMIKELANNIIGKN